jgi:hypothetical protein
VYSLKGLEVFENYVGPDRECNSGGIRVIFYFHNESMPLYLLAAFGKNEKSNPSTEENNY